MGAVVAGALQAAIAYADMMSSRRKRRFIGCFLERTEN
jgi:hypothetical protein